MKEKKQSKGLLIAYWVTTVLFVFELLLGALWDFKVIESIAPGVLTHLGYPQYLLTILAVSKVLAAFVIIIPGFLILKEWAYAGTAFIFLGALASHALAGDGMNEFIWPILYASFTFGSYSLRPDSRKITTV